MISNRDVHNEGRNMDIKMNMYKILHLFRVSNFTEDFIKFVNNNFIENTHEFWIYGDREASNPRIEISLYRNVRYIHCIEEKLKSKELYTYDKIIYHVAFEQTIINLFLLKRRLLKRLYIRICGGDKFLAGNNFQIYMKKYVISNAHALIYIIPEEKQFMKKNYSIKGKQYCALYNLHGIFEKCDIARRMPQRKKDYIAIQLGNSATPSNNHILIMKKLLKFKEENIKIFAPLSYGDNEYADKVIKVGKELFAEKFVGLTDFMTIDKYNEFMNQIDIALFGIKRQQALANIMALLYFGKKVYLRKGSIVEHYFKTECNCNIETIEEIDGMNFHEFINFEEEKAITNEKNMGQLSQLESIKEMWDVIYSERLD